MAPLNLCHIIDNNMGKYTTCKHCSRLNLHAGGCRISCLANTFLEAAIISVLSPLVLQSLSKEGLEWCCHPYVNIKVYKENVRIIIMVNKIEKKSKLSYDGRNLMTRIPKAIEKKAKLKKGDELLWTAKENELEVKKNGS